MQIEKKGMIIDMRDYKRIPFTHMRNCRDLGGYACEDGGFFCFHKVYRADVPFQMTEEEWKQVEDMGVRTIIDLRSLSEQENAKYEVPAGITKVSFPLMREEIDLQNVKSIEEGARQSFGRSLEEGYFKIIEGNTEKVAEALKLIAKSLKKGAILYHCSAGKDRTGIISALIYLLCGVEKRDIVADYQVTATYIAKSMMMASLPDEMKQLLKSDPQSMEAFLEKVENDNLLSKLYDCGLTVEDVEAIKSQVIEY